MAVKKITWKTLIQQINANTIFTSAENELIAIDNLINEYTEGISTKELRDLMNYTKQYFFDVTNYNIWNNLELYVSSFYENDKRFILLLQNKLREYIVFYKKILTDEGVQRALKYAKTYENDGSASSTERGTNSVTPQNSSLYDSTHPESDALFDQAIADFASAIDKNKTSSTSHAQGGSTTDVTGVTWEEGKKNLSLLFFNELKDYIMSLPERVYAYYSLETLPVPELAKKFMAYMQEVEEIFSADE